jgi:hypothetical protein
MTQHRRLRQDLRTSSYDVSKRWKEREKKATICDKVACSVLAAPNKLTRSI